MAKKRKAKRSKQTKLKRATRLLPKSLRDFDRTPLLGFLNSDLGRRILADVLVAAAGAAAAALKRRRKSAAGSGDDAAYPHDHHRTASEDHNGLYAAADEVGSAMNEAVRYIFPATPGAGEGTAADALVRRKKRTRDKRLQH